MNVFSTFQTILQEEADFKTMLANKQQKIKTHKVNQSKNPNMYKQADDEDDAIEADFTDENDLFGQESQDLEQIRDLLKDASKSKSKSASQKKVTLTLNDKYKGSRGQKSDNENDDGIRTNMVKSGFGIDDFAEGDEEEDPDSYSSGFSSTDEIIAACKQKSYTRNFCECVY